MKKCLTPFFVPLLLAAQTSPSGGQAGTSIAMDASGQHIVVGFNDFRGLSRNPVSFSGFAYSDDGGRTFVDGGQLPVKPDGQFSSGLQFPRVNGDPDVKYVPGGNGCQFVYASRLTTGFGTAPNYTSSTATLGIHRSFDCGHTWEGPFEIAPATNPNGQLFNGTTPFDSADKELIDVDPDTGRVLVTWSNFTSSAFRRGGVEISSTYSDDVMTGTPPTWSDRVVVNLSGGGGTGSVPRFAGNGSDFIYVAWQGSGGRGNDIFIAASPNKGLSFADPVKVTPAPFFFMDYPLGNDHIAGDPSLAVDRSPGPNRGNVYVVYATNNSGDGADVVFQRSVDQGATFSPPIYLNADPGFDRPQWFPYVTVDSQTGRVSVIYYDQAIAESGDLTELTWIYSDDGGVTWSNPSPLSPRPFHAGYGNDQNQPNLGDYLGAVAQEGTLYAAFATAPNVALFTDGQGPSPNGIRYPYPNVTVQKGVAAQLPVSLGAVTFAKSGGNGFINPGEQVRLRLPLHSYVLNPVLQPASISGVSATLSTSTPKVTVTTATSPYDTIAPGATVTNSQDFVIQVAPDFVPGTRIDFSLKVTGPQGATATLSFTRNTGTPAATQIFAEDFESVAPGALPKGWSSTHVAPVPPAGVNPTPAGYIVPWTTSNSFCGAASNGLFHINASDGPSPTIGHARWEAVLSPAIAIPADAEYVTLDFDICYDTEEDPQYSFTDYDGALLQIVDLTAGRTNRTSAAEAFAESFQTGAIAQYPRHFPRTGSSSSLLDLSNWGGFSDGLQHVSMRLNGMQGSIVQLRWDYTQNASLTCADVRFGDACGVVIDNIVMKSVKSQPATAP